ncbi:hypothetical protein ACH5RR_041397 [Cinchona calisaya]|uniref:Ribosomal protein L5 n=1 Tax=Cinchona calisaya TaxID=153742 RepID=A0ABD2XWR3_9GENT
MLLRKKRGFPSDQDMRIFDLLFIEYKSVGFTVQLKHAHAPTDPISKCALPDLPKDHLLHAQEIPFIIEISCFEDEFIKRLMLFCRSSSLATAPCSIFGTIPLSKEGRFPFSDATFFPSRPGTDLGSSLDQEFITRRVIPSNKYLASVTITKTQGTMWKNYLKE